MPPEYLPGTSTTTNDQLAPESGSEPVPAPICELKQQQPELAKHQASDFEAVEIAKTRRTALRLGAALTALSVTGSVAFYAIQRFSDTADKGINAVAGVINSFIPKQTVDLQVQNFLHSIELPESIPLVMGKGTSGATLTTHDRVLGIGYSGSVTKVTASVSVTLDLEGKAVTYSPVRVEVPNSKGGSSKEWRLKATVSPEVTDVATKKPENTFRYVASILDVQGIEDQDGKIRRLGGVLVGSNADQRVKLSLDQAVNSFGTACAPTIQRLVGPLVVAGIKDSFKVLATAKQIENMPDQVVSAIDQITKNDPLVDFVDVSGKFVSPDTIKLDVAPANTKKYLAHELGIDEKDLDLEDGSGRCLMDEAAQQNLVKLTQSPAAGVS